MSALEILIKAREYEIKGNNLEAINLYEDGIRKLIPIYENEKDVKLKLYIKRKYDDYIERVERIKNILEKSSIRGKVIDKIHIIDGVTGYTYERIFGKYLNNDVLKIQIEEPYLEKYFQLLNLMMFMELVVKKCNNLKLIELTTSSDPNKNAEKLKELNQLKIDLKERKIELKVVFIENMHDRQIILSNGYTIKIGRGLHIFKPSKGKFALGSTDFSFRECKNTYIDIFN